MRGDEVIEDGTVVIDGNRIIAVGTRANVSDPRGREGRSTPRARRSCPGIVDVHWHGSMGADGIIPQQNWVNYASLAFGVTTIHDPSNDTARDLRRERDGARPALIVAPRIFSTGTILYGAKAPFKAEINSLDDALRAPAPHEGRRRDSA